MDLKKIEYKTLDALKYQTIIKAEYEPDEFCGEEE